MEGGAGMNDHDHMEEECGVFGIFRHPDAANLTYLGLYSLQHRGQEGCGIVANDGGEFHVIKQMGLVSEVFNSSNLKQLKGDTAIGHVRYSTTGSSHLANVQPLYASTPHGQIAIAHNGNLTNAAAIHQKLTQDGAIFQSTVDSEVILHLMSRSKASGIVNVAKEVLVQVEGAYSLVIMGEDFLMAARDPFGFRPLVIGKLSGAYVVASETCALDLIGATLVREVQPAEVVLIDANGISSHSLPVQPTPKFCVFEHVYFARPDSVVFGDNVHLVRKAFGRQLAREFPVNADFVMAIPDSGNSAALGYAEESRIPFEIGMTRNHYVGRTFIQPSQEIRDFWVKVKLNPIREVIRGKRVIVVDDSLVRGTTSKQRVSAIRDAGASEIHLRISSPPILHPCHFGIDTPKRDKLIAANKSIEEIREYIGADTLGYLSLDGMLSAIKSTLPDHFCTGCFTGNYPIHVDTQGEYSLESKKVENYAKKN